MLPLPSVTKLCVVSECGWSPYLSTLLAAAVNVEHIVTGNSTAEDLDDKMLAELMSGDNRLAKLKTLKVIFSIHFLSIKAFQFRPFIFLTRFLETRG